MGNSCRCQNMSSVVGKFAKDEKRTEGSGDWLEGWGIVGAGSDKMSP